MIATEEQIDIAKLNKETAAELLADPTAHLSACVARRLGHLLHTPEASNATRLQPRSADERMARKTALKNVFQLALIARRGPRRARILRKTALRYTDVTVVAFIFGVATEWDRATVAAVEEHKRRINNPASRNNKK